MKKYYIYGLGIKSEIALYRLEQYDGDADDVHIHYGEISEDIKAYIAQGKVSSRSAHRVWLHTEMGHFIILNGNEIVLQPAPNVTEEQLASYVLGWCMAFLFEQRGISAIHSSALVWENQAFLLAGSSGVGKSTLALGLLEKGCEYLADDIAMVDIEKDMLIQPAFPQQKICRDVAEKMSAEEIYYVDEKKDKFARINTEDFCDKPKRLSAIFLLNIYDEDEVKIERLKGLDKWNGVLRNLFLVDAYRAFGVPIEEKNRCLKIAGAVEMYMVWRPRNRDTLAEICNKVMALLGNRELGE